MSKVVSRASLYDSESEPEVDDTPSYMPNLEFEFVEVEAEAEDDIEDVKEQEPEEFEFPLFGGAAKASAKEEDRGREEVKVMTVSMREPSEERINNDRPEWYYFSRPTPEQRAQYSSVAVEYEDIFRGEPPTSGTGRCIDLDVHNAEVAARLLKEKIRARNKRPGKRKRMGIIESRERRKERAKAEKRAQREARSQMYRPKYYRGGGNKKTRGASKTKYRTE